MSELNRRDFVIAAACAAGACMMCGSLAEAAESNTAAGGNKVDAGNISDYAKDGVYDKFADSKKVLIAREKGKLYAMSAVCTHKMGTVKLDQKGELMCPKHKSFFNDEGKPTHGPAKAALFRLGISQTADGTIQVDPNKKFGENQWSDAGASISVKSA